MNRRRVVGTRDIALGSVPDMLAKLTDQRRASGHIRLRLLSYQLFVTGSSDGIKLLGVGVQCRTVSSCWRIIRRCEVASAPIRCLLYTSDAADE